MLPTLEVRWFFPGPLPAAAAAWFDGLGEPVEEEARTDRYLVPTEGDALGVKVREGRIEAKQRTARAEASAWGRATARPETWRKWSFELAADEGEALDDAWTEVAKARRQRWLQFDGAVCALEISTVRCDGDAWWSVCLETAGERAADRQRALHGAAARWLDRADAPALPQAAAQGYPAWLRDRASPEPSDAPSAGTPSAEGPAGTSGR